MRFINYPPNKQHISPFEPIEADCYFAHAGNFSYLGNYEEIGNIRSPYDVRSDILAGAFVLNIFKRHSIVQNGKRIFTNKNFDDGHIIGASRLKEIRYAIVTDELQEYKIDSWKEELLKDYSINNNDGSYNCALQLKLFSDADSAIEYAVELSKKSPAKYVIAQWFADIDRH